MESNFQSPEENAVMRIIEGDKPFALVRCDDGDDVLILEGDVTDREKLDDIPREQGTHPDGRVIDTISAIPYSQVHERGYETAREKQNDPKIRCMQVRNSTRISLQRLLEMLPQEEIELNGEIKQSHTDKQYAKLVRDIKEDEIGQGEGANMVVPRRETAQIKDYSRSKLLSVFRSLLRNETGTYMTFAFHDGERTLVGASPERHLTVEDGVVTMNPISGTLKKIKNMSKQELIDFLQDPKEVMELMMVLDEELKMMAQMCEKGGVIQGPLLKEMSRLIHTEYMLVGKSLLNVIELMRHSMWAPTVTGSPVENACRIIEKYDKQCRRYYSAALAMIGRDEEGGERLDSSILIRTMEIDNEGNVEMCAGTTIVRDSDPDDEAQEANTKLAGLRASLQNGGDQEELEHVTSNPAIVDAEVMETLRSRNMHLSAYHFEDQEDADLSIEELHGVNITIIANGDDFCFTLRNMIVHMGANVNVVHYSEYEVAQDSSDLVIVGPGPGNPNNIGDEKMGRLHGIVQELRDSGKPMLGVCLGHQIICRQIGMDVAQKQNPSQGAWEQIDLFGHNQLVGFYNTFAAQNQEIDGVDVSFDESTNEVHAIQSDTYA